MSTDLLFENFSTMTTAPYGIPRIRELILQLAVHGKLGTHDPEDEPAARIVEKIRIQKEKLVKEGKISKQQLKDHISTDITLPNNWLIGHLDDFFYRIPITKNKIPTSSFKKEGPIPVIDQSQRFIAGYTNENGKILKIPDPVIIFGDHTREIKYIDFDFVVGADGVIVLKPLNGYEKYFYLVMNSLMFEDKGYSRHFKILSNYLFPLPPLAEQYRIVEKVDRLMVLCDELEAQQQRERAGYLKLGTSSLSALQNTESPEEFERLWVHVCDAFDLILDCPENVDVLRQTILQLAVQGRLVRQDPGDEPAWKLIERIKLERNNLMPVGIIKKEKQAEPVDEYENIFPLPNGWIWVKLYNLIVWGPRNGYSPVPSTLPTNTKVLTLSSTTRGFFDNRFYKYLNEDISPDSHLWLNEGDILIQRSNAPGYVGISAIYHGKSNLFIYPDLMMKFRVSAEVNSQYIHSVINCGFSRNYFTKKAIGTSGSMKKVNQDIVGNLLIPLPPLAEQHRIVAKVNALMTLCDALESRLKERAELQGSFTDTVVKVVGGENA